MEKTVITNVVLLVRDRPELTRQAVQTMFLNSGASFNLTVVDDGSREETRLDLERVARDNANRMAVLRLYPPRGIVGLCRNLGILASERIFSERIFGRGDFLYLADNDGFYLPGWLEKLTQAFVETEPQGIRLLGGCRHPYHGTNRVVPCASASVHTHDAVQGISHLMRWLTWDSFGPFDAHAKGTNQSEDYAFCQKLIRAGYLVGSVYPRCVLNCGLLDSYGKPCVGYDAVKAELLGEIKARGLEGKVFYPEGQG